MQTALNLHLLKTNTKSNAYKNSDKLNLAKVNFYWQRHRSRQQLAKLTEEQLKDIGINAETARLESQKPFWK